MTSAELQALRFVLLRAWLTSIPVATYGISGEMTTLVPILIRVVTPMLQHASEQTKRGTYKKKKNGQGREL